MKAERTQTKLKKNFTIFTKQRGVAETTYATQMLGMVVLPPKRTGLM